MPHLHWQRSFLMTVLAAQWMGAAHARPVPVHVHWEKIHVYNLAPTAVFAKLGLTHSVKNGYTRDGKQGVADPTFPPGLTDVVPYDAAKTLIVRGTAGGLSLFRSRVLAADVPSRPIRFTASLTQHQGTDELPTGATEQYQVSDSIPAELHVGGRIYQIKAHTNADGSLWIACRVSLPLPLPPTVPDAPPAAVFVPQRVWTDPLSRRLRPGETAVFEDLASFRSSAGRKLGATGVDTADDYTLRIMLTPSADDPNLAAPTAPPPL